jgi:hypothetical protein
MKRCVMMKWVVGAAARSRLPQRRPDCVGRNAWRREDRAAEQRLRGSVGANGELAAGEKQIPPAEDACGMTIFLLVAGFETVRC